MLHCEHLLHSSCSKNIILSSTCKCKNVIIVLFSRFLSWINFAIYLVVDKLTHLLLFININCTYEMYLLYCIIYV